MLQENHSMSLTWAIAAIVLVSAASAQQMRFPDLEVPPVNNPPAEWTRTVSMELAAPHDKRGGEAWDMALDTPFICVPGTPVCTGTPKAASSHPDMWLIVFDAQGNRTGYLTPPEDRRVEDQGFIARWLSARGLKPYARCPNSLVCTYNDIKIPNRAFGVVILDQDIKEHDMMLAAVVIPAKVGEEEVEAIEKHIHDYLNDLTAQRQLAGASPFRGTLPTAPMSECERSKEMCFLDSSAGLPGLRITTMRQVVPGLTCSASTSVKGAITARAGKGKEMIFDFQATSNTCTGTLTYLWEFDGQQQEETAGPSLKRRFEDGPPETLKLTVRCHRSGRACELEPIKVELSEKKP